MIRPKVSRILYFYIRKCVTRFTGCPKWCWTACLDCPNPGRCMQVYSQPPIPGTWIRHVTGVSLHVTSAFIPLLSNTTNHRPLKYRPHSALRSRCNRLLVTQSQSYVSNIVLCNCEASCWSGWGHGIEAGSVILIGRIRKPRWYLEI